MVILNHKPIQTNFFYYCFCCIYKKPEFSSPPHPMQLSSDESSDSMLVLLKNLESAKILLNCLDSDGCGIYSGHFTSTLSGQQELFPALSVKFSEFKTQNLGKLNQAKRTELKLALKEDMAPLLAKAGEAARGPKLFLQEALPSDPDECIPRLGEIKERKRREIEQLEHEIEELDFAVFVAENIQKIKRSAGSFDDACFASLQTKKQRV